jgi:formate hydrogenlyase subunit 4
MVVGCIFAVIDNSFSKLRLFKITEFLAAAFLLAVLAVLVFYLGGG